MIIDINTRLNNIWIRSCSLIILSLTISFFNLLLQFNAATNKNSLFINLTELTSRLKFLTTLQMLLGWRKLIRSAAAYRPCTTPDHSAPPSRVSNEILRLWPTQLDLHCVYNNPIPYTPWLALSSVLINEKIKGWPYFKWFYVGTDEWYSLQHSYSIDTYS